MVIHGDPLDALKTILESGQLDNKPPISLGFVGNGASKLLITVYFCKYCWCKKKKFQPSVNPDSTDLRQKCHECNSITDHTRIQCLEI